MLQPNHPTAANLRELALAGLLCLLLLPLPGQAQINKCLINGKIVYTDQDCPEESGKKLNLYESTFSAPKTVRLSPPTTSGSGQYQSPEWFRDARGYRKAMEISRELNVPIFIYAYTDWCGYCKVFHKELLNDSGVKQALSGFVKVKINPEHGPADKHLFNQWGGSGYPTLFIQPGNASAPARAGGPFKQVNGKWKLMNRKTFIAMLESRQN